jgi:serine/threonine protein kinase
VGVLHGLHAAHEVRGEDGRPLGLVHRDVSPQNVVVGADGMARVLDFGIAKALHKNHVTVDGRTKGRIAYIAPEQLTGAGVTRQADVYSAGVVLWEMLTGQHLFDEPNEAALASRVLEGRVSPPSEVAPGVPAALDAIVLRALAAERRDRFATAQEMAVELETAVTPATNEEVARWLERIAGDLLETRATQSREAESFVPGSSEQETKRRAPMPFMVATVGLLAIAVSVIVIGTMAFHAARRPATPMVPASSPSSSDSVVVVAPSDNPAPRPSSDTQVRPARSTRAASCDPPYYFDSKGIKRYKVACLN